jgi:hypothetical protein
MDLGTERGTGMGQDLGLGTGMGLDLFLDQGDIPKG